MKIGKRVDNLKDMYIVPDMINELLSASENGLSGISKKLSMIISLPIIITDNYYNGLSASFSYDKLEIVVSTHFESYQNTSFFSCSLDFEGNTSNGLGFPIRSDHQIFGYIFILTDNSQHSKMEVYESLIRYTATLCTFHMKQLLDIKKEKHRFKDAFLFDMLYGNFKNRDDIISYGTIWKWELDQPHVVIVFSIIDYNHYSMDKQLIEAILYITEKALSQHGIEPITLRKQSEVIAIIPINENTIFQQKDQLTQFIKYIFEQMKETSLSERVACGVGQVYENSNELFRSYQEAKVAYEIGLLLKIDIPFFNDIGLERVLYKHDLQDLREFFTHVLGDLKRYDEDNSSELMLTLESFASHQFDLKQTSEAIFLHRNTLRYRIKKIEEILNIKLDDFNNRLNITAALKIKQLHKM